MNEMDETSHLSVPDSDEGDFRSFQELNSTTSCRSRASSPATSGAPSSSWEMKSFEYSPDTASIPGGLDTTSCSGPYCRICYEGDEDAPLMSFCRCSGSIGLVHVSCLELWLNRKQTDTCEICQQRFPTVEKKRPLKEWIQIRWLACRKEVFFMQLVSFILFTLIAAFSVERSFRIVSSKTRTAWQAATSLFFSSSLVSSFVAFTCMTVRKPYMDFRGWQEANVKVTLLWREESTREHSVNSIA